MKFDGCRSEDDYDPGCISQGLVDMRRSALNTKEQVQEVAQREHRMET